MGSEFLEKQRTARNIAKLRQICEERFAGTTSLGKVSERAAFVTSVGEAATAPSDQDPVLGRHAQQRRS